MNTAQSKIWTADQLLELGRSYQAAAVYAAAADLELFGPLAKRSLTANQLAVKVRCPRRGLAVLLDALTALQLLVKRRQRYSLAPGAAPLLGPDGPMSILGMAQHQANCLRRWAQLAQVVERGRPAARTPSVRGKARDEAAFITAMHNVSAPVADQLIRRLQPLGCRHWLDVGGASGTWTIACLRAWPQAAATLFDLPHVIPMARRRLTAAGLGARVRFVAGDFLKDPLPKGADLAWVSAIVHQNSRAQNRRLFARVFGAMDAGGRIVIRDVIMAPDRVRPAVGALFAINMLVATPRGGTYTFDELRQDLQTAGFRDVRLARRDEGMNCLLTARKPSRRPPRACLTKSV